MKRSEIKNEVFEGFASDCIAREAKLLTMIEECRSEAADVEATLGRMSVELHDHIGDSKLIGLDEIAAVVAELDTIVLQLKASYRDDSPPLKRDRIASFVLSGTFVSWIKRLTKVTAKYATTVGDEGQAGELQTLRLELGKVLKRLKPSKRRNSSITEPTIPVAQLRTLVLDDSAISRRMLTKALEEKGHSVVAVENSTEFFKTLKEYSPQLVFLDVNMPDIRGDKVCQMVRKSPGMSDPLIIIFSSLPDEELAVLAEQSGASGYLSNQRGLDALVSYLDDLLEEVVL